ncbi:MAG: tRNA (guanosine(46)-N7)-methyltransferase TrmB, partial [Bacteroidetes bacterium]|nr:tRNA (guanosine(46)-N7)-methyltransferase TrmB [Bacteroidota bacterium]
MAKKKLERFKENLTFPNLFQLSYQEQQQGFVYKGNWPVFFGNNNPIVLELRCGKGDYTIFLTEKNKELNYIGIDIKGARLWRGCKSSLEKNMKNVAFIRTYAQMLEQYFTPGEVSEI